MSVQNSPIQNSPIQNSPEKYENERKKQSDTKQFEKQSQLIIVLTSRQAENCPLLNKRNEQNSDRRSRANVLRACQQRVGLNTKFRAGYRRKAATRAQRAHRRPLTGQFCIGLFFPLLHDFWDCFVWDCFVYAPIFFVELSMYLKLAKFTH